MKPDQAEQYFYSPHPTRVTIFFRTFFPWQLIKFILINIKMLRMISKSHGKS